jgi:hypothetical protein
MDEVKDMRWGDFKPVLAEAIIDHLAPIQVCQEFSPRPLMSPATSNRHEQKFCAALRDSDYFLVVCSGAGEV